jgi:hypothetical protein
MRSNENITHMEAVEFITEVKGRHIEMPDERYNGWRVKVLLLDGAKRAMNHDNPAYPHLNPEEHFHYYRHHTDNFEETNPFLEITDTTSFAREIRDIAWKR